MGVIILGRHFVNNKTGKKYYVTGLATNTTNAQDGQEMILYQRVVNGNLDRSITFCRQLAEFKDKFKETI